MTFKPLTDRLEALARSKPNADARAFALEALSSKWEGVRVAAVTTLCAWGDQASVQQAKEAVSALAAREAGWSAVGAMSEALAPHLRSQDEQWLLHLIGRSAHPSTLHSLRSLVEQLNTPAFREALASLVAHTATDARKLALLRVAKYAGNVSARSGA